jgi:hypothetical protein
MIVCRLTLRAPAPKESYWPKFSRRSSESQMRLRTSLLAATLQADTPIALLRWWRHRIWLPEFPRKRINFRTRTSRLMSRAGGALTAVVDEPRA